MPTEQESLDFQDSPPAVERTAMPTEQESLDFQDSPPAVEVTEVTPAEVTHTSDTLPPGELIEQTPEERQAEKEGRINTLVARVLPTVKARKIGHNVNAPWLSNPHVDETVKATIEALYDLEFNRQ